MRYKRLFPFIPVSLALLPSVLQVHAEVIEQKTNPASRIIRVSDEAWQPEGFVNGAVISASYLALDEIVIDGRDDEEAWRMAAETRVPLAYGSTASASLKALYTDQDVMIRLRWQDDDEDRQYHPWRWSDAEEQYLEGSQIDDSVLLSFEAGCEWTPSLLGGYIHDFDGWQWFAARSDPLGQAVDLYGNVQDREIRNSARYDSRVIEDVWMLKFIDHSEEKLHADWDQLDRVYMRQPVTRELYVRMEPDGMRGQSSYMKQIPAPTTDPYPRDASMPLPQYRPVRLTDGAGEVQAKGEWSNGNWTVEFRRTRVTPARHINDTIFSRLTQFSVHIFDGTERLDRASESGRLFLRFLPEEQAPVDSTHDESGIANR